jgi:hypothetical protein
MLDDVLQAHVRIASEKMCDILDTQVKLHGGKSNQLLFSSMKKLPPHLAVTDMCSKWIEIVAAALKQRPQTTADLNALLWDRFLSRVQLSPWLIDTSQARGYEVMCLFSKSCKDVVYAHFGVPVKPGSIPPRPVTPLLAPAPTPTYSPTYTQNPALSFAPTPPTGPSLAPLAQPWMAKERGISQQLPAAREPERANSEEIPAARVADKPGIPFQFSRRPLPTVPELKVPRRRKKRQEESSESE